MAGVAVNCAAPPSHRQPMANLNIVFLHGLRPPLAELVCSAFTADYDVRAISGSAPEQQQADAIGEADFIVIYRAKPSERVLRSAKNARLIQILAAGYEDMNLPLLRELGIPFANNGGANSTAVADQALLFMLSLYRRVLATDSEVRAGKWNTGIDGLNTFEMADKVVGVLGMGNIGQKVARRVQAFDAKVQYFNRTALAPDVEVKLGVTRVSLDELFRTSDILTLHTPLTPETFHLVSKERMAMMKPTAIIINTSRGAVIDEAALVEALKTGQIAGAGLDGFETEPVAHDSALLSLPNVVLSPHSGGTTSDTWRRRGQFAFENITRVLNGQTPESLVHLG